MGYEYGNLSVDEGFENDPLESFRKHKVGGEVAEKTIKRINRALEENKNGTGYRQFLEEHRGVGVLEVSVDDLIAFKDYLREQGFSDGGIDTHLRWVASFYAKLLQLGVHDANPAAYVLDELDLDTSPPDRVYISLPRMAEFVQSLSDPQLRALAVIFLKWAVRRGEAANIDLRCLHLDDPRYREDYLEHHDIELHEKIENRPDTVYIYADINAGEEVAGEVRVDGNKRQRETIIPIDKETKEVLLQWLSFRPRTPGPAHPLFTTGQTVDGEFQRIRGSTIWGKIVKDHGRAEGLAKAGYDPTDFDIHFFRHFFSTQMQRTHGDHDGGIDPTLVKYIRGDVLDDEILGIYTHDNWGVNTRSPYLENIYNLGIYGRSSF